MFDGGTYDLYDTTFFGMSDNDFINIKLWIVANILFVPESFQITTAQNDEAEAKECDYKNIMLIPLSLSHQSHFHYQL